MWDKDTWPNNRSNTSVKLLWLFGLVERSHCWPSAGLKSITDMPSHMIRLQPAEPLETWAFVICAPAQWSVLSGLCAARSWRMTDLIPVKPLELFWATLGPYVGLKVTEILRPNSVDAATWMREAVELLPLRISGRVQTVYFSKSWDTTI